MRILAYVIAVLFSLISSLVLTSFITNSIKVSTSRLYSTEASKLLNYVANQIIYTYYHCTDSDVSISVVLPRRIANNYYILRIQPGKVSITISKLNIEEELPIPIYTVDTILLYSKYKNALGFSCKKGTMHVVIT